VFSKLADAKQNRPNDLKIDSPYLLDLLPDRWAVAHPEAVIQDRIAEKQMVSELKRARRARQRIANRQPTESAT